MWEPVALCCFSRRTGCLVLGFFEVITAVIGMITAMCFLIARGSGNYSFLCSGRNMTKEECFEMAQPAGDAIIAILVLCGVVVLICASLMVRGVKKNNHCLMCPFLVLHVLVVVAHIITAGVFVPLLCINYNVSVGIFFAYCSGGLVFTWTYFLLTVRAYYYELKRGTADDHHRLDETFEVEIDGGNNL